MIKSKDRYFEVFCDYCNRHIELGYWLPDGKDCCMKCMEKRRDAKRIVKEHKKSGLL